jgi:plasmid replication initiation protein
MAIITKKDEEGRVIAYGEFRIVDDYGMEDKYGHYAWINDVWVHEKFRTREGVNMLLKEFIDLKHQRMPWVRWIYWTRKKHGGRMSKYEIRSLLHESLS